jgi:hypothetical protein
VSELPKRIAAALYWDLPALVADGSRGTAAFRAALEPPPFSELEAASSAEPADALARAGQGIFLERIGRLEEASAIFAALRADPEAGLALLGACLSAWSSSATTASFEEARSLIEVLGDDVDKARLFAKLATFAYDTGLADEFARDLERAFTLAPVPSALRRALAMVRVNKLRREFDPADFEASRHSDPLVEYEWISELALKAAGGELEEALKARSESAWTWTFSSGRTRRDEVIAAELQASWAGALWLREPLRRQLGAQVLLAETELNPGSVLYALTMWTVSGGSNVRRVIETYERHFGETTADELIKQVAQAIGLRDFADITLARSAAATWDLLSEEVAISVLDRLAPYLSEEALGQEARQVWAQLAIRFPDPWAERIVSLDPAASRLVLAEMTDNGLSRLPITTVESIRGHLEGVADDAPDGDELMIALHTRSGTEVPQKYHPRSPAAIANAVGRFPELFDDAALQEVEQRYADALRQEVREALGGSAGFGGPTTSSRLADIVLARGGAEGPAVAALLDAATDEQVPGHLRFDALLALARIAHRGALSEEQYAVIRGSPDHGAPSFFAPTSRELLRVAKLLVLRRVLSQSEQGEAFALTRDGDARVRQLAVNVCTLYLRERASIPLEAGLIGGFYDPDETVVRQALGGLRGAHLEFEGAARMIAERIDALFHERSHWIRAEAASVARAMISDGSAEEAYRRVVVAAVRDRSWMVRKAATEDDATDADD